MSEMSETSGDDLEPAPNGHSSVGHYSDITGHQADINPDHVRLMSGKCPAPEPAPARSLTPPPDMTDMTDIKKPCLSGGTADSQDKRLSVPKSKDPDCGQKFKPGQMVQWTDRPDNSLKIMSEMSETSGDDLEPAPNGHSSVGHYSDITGHQADINPDHVRLMSGKCPTPEPAPARGLTLPPDMTDISDIKKPCLSGGTADSQDKRLSVPKSKDPDCGQKFKLGLMVR
jgi:hypothetical protein